MAVDPNALVLRPATIDDSEFAYGLKKLALGEYVTRVWGWDEDFQRDYHMREFAPEGTDIIEYHSKDVGLVRVEQQPECVYVRHLYLLPQVQRQGIGSHIVRRIIEEANTRKLPVRLHVLKVNSGARSLYERLGFTVYTETETHYEMQSVPAASILS